MAARIALVANTAWYVFNFRSALIQSLLQEGYEIDVIAPYDSYAEKFKEWGIQYFPIKMNNKGTNPIEDLSLTQRFYRYFKRERPDAILAYTIKPNIYASIAARMFKIPVINNISGLGTLFIEQNLITKLATAMYKFALRRSATVFFQNDDDLAAFLNAKLANPSVVERIPGSGVDTERFQPSETRRTSSEFVFLLLARMLWQKGVGEYIKAARDLKSRYPKIRFQLLGFLDVANRSAISSAQMKEWTEEGVVEYLGVRDDVVEPLRAADCVVLPSYYREGVPRSLLEAASVGKPIITTRTIGCQDVVDDGANGFLCEPRDAEDLANKMEQMISLSENERLEMGGRGREKMIREFDERIVIDRYLAAVRAIMMSKTALTAEPA